MFKQHPSILKINKLGYESIEKIINIYEKHPSILKIKENVKVEQKFMFT